MMLRNVKQNVQKKFFLKIRDNNFSKLQRLNVSEFIYKNIPDEKSFNEVIEMADRSQSEMIQGVMRVLEKEGKEMDDNTINRYLKKYSKDILLNYMYIMG